MKTFLGFSAFRMFWRERTFWWVLLYLVCGVVIGGYAGMHADRSGIALLAKTVQEQNMMQQAWSTAIPVRLMETLGWILAAIIIGQFPARRLMLVLLIVVRGFLFGFALSVIPAELGWWGVYLSLVTAGLSAILSLPAFLFSAAAVLLCCRQYERRQYFHAIGKYRIIFQSSIVLCLISAAYRLTLAQLLLTFYP